MRSARIAPNLIAAAEIDLAANGSAIVPLELWTPFFGSRFTLGPVRMVVIELGDGEIEWYVPGNIRYHGNTVAWKERMVAPLIAGGRLFWRGENGLAASAQALVTELHAEARVYIPRGCPDFINMRDNTSKREGTDIMPTRISQAHGDVEALFGHLSTAVLGQDQVLRPLAELVTRHRYRGVKRRPAVACLVGPTGVGKTRAAEALAEALAKLHPRESWFYARIDCGSLAEPHSVSRLNGAPPGYVGHNSSQSLADVVAAHPRTIVLLDEIEKATPAIYPILLAILDQGRISRADSLESAVDATACVILWTSNLGAESLVRNLDMAKAWDDRAARLATTRQALSGSGLKPELVGRVQQAFPFRPLDDALRARIVRDAITRLGSDYGVNVAEVEDAVVAAVLAETFDSRWGARPDENAAIDLLADAFLAVEEGDGPVAVLAGPPIHCAPLSVPSRR